MKTNREDERDNPFIHLRNKGEPHSLRYEGVARYPDEITMGMVHNLLFQFNLFETHVVDTMNESDLFSRREPPDEHS